jgi:hypothetical protein
VILIKYFNSILKTDIRLNCEYIQKSNTKYLIKKIKKITVKRTTKGYVREIKINLDNGISTYINNSNNDVEKFLIRLKEYIPKGTIIKVIDEPLDFDHIIFYPALGIVISFVSVEFVRFFVNFGNEYMNLISYVVSSFTFILGMYFILYKPIYKRDDRKGQKADYIWGGFFIIGSVLVLISIYLK